MHACVCMRLSPFVCVFAYSCDYCVRCASVRVAGFVLICGRARICISVCAGFHDCVFAIVSEGVAGVCAHLCLCLCLCPLPGLCLCLCSYVSVYLCLRSFRVCG